MKNEEVNNIETPQVKIDKSLNKYKDVVLFPEKLEKTNEMLRRTELPKELINKDASAEKSGT